MFVFWTWRVKKKKTQFRHCRILRKKNSITPQVFHTLINWTAKTPIWPQIFRWPRIWGQIDKISSERELFAYSDFHPNWQISLRSGEISPIRAQIRGQRKIWGQIELFAVHLAKVQKIWGRIGDFGVAKLSFFLWTLEVAKLSFFLWSCQLMSSEKKNPAKPNVQKKKPC